MKRILVQFGLFTFFYYPSFAQNQDIETIKKLNLSWLNSFPKKDSIAMARVLADDFILITPQGYRENRKDNLLNLMSPKIEFHSVVVDSMDVRLLSADIGILTAWTSFAFKFDGKETRARNCYQDIYVKRQNRWFAVQAHVSSIINSR